MDNFYKKVLDNFYFSVSKYDKFSKSLYWENSIKKKKNLFKVEKLNNFRSNNLSKNIDDFYLDKKIMMRMYQDLKKKCGKKFLNKFLSSKNIGNAKINLRIDGKLITASDLFHSKYLYDINKKLKLKKLNTICEIGQGFGLLASKFYHVKNYKMILIDLPESNFITSYFLKKNFPKKKIFLDIDLKNNFLSEENFSKGEIFIISPWIKLDKKIKVDLFINSRSMMEMNYDSINEYFDLINNHSFINSYFLCINRYYKDLVGYPIEFHRYPFTNNWKTIISKSSWEQSHIHFLLVKKVSEKNSDIFKTLEQIKTKYKKIVKNDNFFFRRILPIDIYRFYKLLKNFLSNK